MRPFHDCYIECYIVGIGTWTISVSCRVLSNPVSTSAYSITVHKAQNLTVDQAVLDITEKDFVPSLTYVAVSRVKSLHGILFEQPFDFVHFSTGSRGAAYSCESRQTLKKGVDL